MSFNVDEAVPLVDPELERRDAEAEGLCHEMTQRLKLLHDERASLSAEMRQLSVKNLPVRLIAADNALAAMATAGIAGMVIGAAVVRRRTARRQARMNESADNRIK